MLYELYECSCLAGGVFSHCTFSVMWVGRTWTLTHFTDGMIEAEGTM